MKRKLLPQKLLNSSLNLIKVPNLKWKTYSEAHLILINNWYSLKNPDARMKRYDHSDWSYINIQDTWRVSRSWSKVKPNDNPNERWYNARFNYLWDKLENQAHDTWENIIF